MKKIRRKPHNWLAEHEQFLADNIKGTPIKRLTDDLNKHFSLDLTYSQVKGRCSKLKLVNGINACFKKGQVPYTKGKKWDEYMSPEAQANSMRTTFKKGDIPKNTKPIGSERIDTRDGYVLVKTAEPNVWRHKQYVEWEKVNGPVPEDKRFIFLDGDRENCSVDNLALVDFGVGAIMNSQGLHVKGDSELMETSINTVNLIRAISNRSNKSNT